MMRALLTSLFVYDKSAPLLFSGGQFLLWFSLFYAGFLWLRSRRVPRLVYLCAFSWFFYYKCSGAFLGALLFTTLADYTLARWIAQSENPRTRRALLTLSITLSGGLLVYFKYTNFLLGGLGRALAVHFQPLDIALPAGISFYTFESISYVVDVYRRRLSPAQSVFEYAAYLSYFPHLMAGPIMRAEQLLPELRAEPELSAERVGTGLFLVLSGLLKKAILADYLARFSDSVFAGGAGLTGFELLLGVYGYAFQIYADFSGYSDMALGLARLSGIQLPENFRAPYAATSITEFWRRWHITLSSWLRDYIYIPLGGNRHGRLRTYLNLCATMLFGGLWHGASLTFVLWGGLHGLLLCFERIAEAPLARLRAGRLGRVLSCVVTFHVVTLLWVLFRAGDLHLAFGLLTRIATDLQPTLILPVLRARSTWLLALGAAALSSVVTPALFEDWARRFSRTPLWARAALLLVVLQLTLECRSVDIQPFIYFRF